MLQLMVSKSHYSVLYSTTSQMLTLMHSSNKINKCCSYIISFVQKKAKIIGWKNPEK